MQLVSWNVNGLRACLKNGFESAYMRLTPDIFALQEIRLQDCDAIEKLLTAEHYATSRHWHPATARKGYSGTAVFSKVKPLAATRGFMLLPSDSPLDPPDDEGRVLTLEYDAFFLVNVYTPNSQDGLRRIDYRMAWEDSFRKYLKHLDQIKPVIVCGDLNVAHNEIDLAHPAANRGSNGFSDEERGKLTDLLASGFVDTFRKRYPDQKGAYTWWSNIANARSRNVGWRIDYFLISQRLWNDTVTPYIYPEIRGSDHCPIGLTLDI